MYALRHAVGLKSVILTSGFNSLKVRPYRIFLFLISFYQVSFILDDCPFIVLNEYFKVLNVNILLSATRKLYDWNLPRPNPLSHGPNSQPKPLSCVL